MVSKSKTNKRIFKIRIYVKVWIGQALLGHLDSWSRVTLKPTAIESHHLRNFGFSNEEIDPKIGIYAKNWARQVILENFDFRSRFMKKSTFWKLDVCAISEFQMMKRIPKLECTQKTEWDKPLLKILTFWSKSKVHLVKVFFKFFLQAIQTRSWWMSQTGSAWVKPG